MRPRLNTVHDGLPAVARGAKARPRFNTVQHGLPAVARGAKARPRFNTVQHGLPAVARGAKAGPRFNTVQHGLPAVARGRRRGHGSTRFNTALTAALIAVAALSACNRGGPPSSGGSTTGTTIAVIPKGTSHVFWQSIHAGAQKAADELKVSIIWRGPLREDDRDSQVSEVEGFISRGVSGIVLAPLDESALVGPVSEAMRRKIPVVIFDSGLKGNDYVSFVATDNTKGGELAGNRLAEVLQGKGKVVLIRYAEGHDSTGRREQGFLDAIAKHPGIEVVSSNQYGGADVEGFYKKAEALLSRYKKPDGSLGIDGLFCSNESGTFATMRVLQDNGWAGKVKFVGFDASENLVKGLRSGTLNGLVVQDPVRMGYLAVKTMVSHLHGEKVERWIDTGVQVATPENMDQPQMKELLQPDLSKWLK